MFILVFIITLLVLVVIHELGHFFAAKKFNIKVLEFGFGIPPRVFGKKWGETIVSLNWLPFGGFVRLLGEDEEDKRILDNKRSFAAQKVSVRILVVLAGVIMNLLLAWIIFWVVLLAQNFSVTLPLLSDHRFLGVYQTNEKMIIIGSVAKDSPAEKANLKSGDRIVAFNDRFLKDSNDLVDYTRKYAGEKIKLTVSDIEKKSYWQVELTPRVNPPEGQGSLGVSLSSFDIVNLEYKEIWQKILSGPIHSLNLAVYSGKILGQLISQSITKQDLTPVSQSVSGPIGITYLTKEVISLENPIIPYLNFLGSLSLSLSLMNVLPFPGLDGGRLFFLLIEALTRKKVHPTIEKYVHNVGLALLLGLIVLISISDIQKFLLPR